MNMKRSELAAAVDATAAKIKEQNLLAVDTAGNTTGNEDVFAKTLPDDLTMAQVNRVDEHRIVFTTASGQVFGQNMIEAMKTNPELKTGVVSIPAGSNVTISHSFDRHKVFPNPQAKEEGQPQTVDRYGVLSTKVSGTAGKNTGLHASLRQELQDAAAAAFGV